MKPWEEPDPKTWREIAVDVVGAVVTWASLIVAALVVLLLVVGFLAWLL